MRMRRNWQGEAVFSAMAGVVPADPQQCHGCWAELFGRKAPLHLELGMGKGDFILGMARRYPQWNFIGVERVPTIAYIAARKNQEQPLANLRFLLLDGKDLPFYFQPEELNCIYLNFSDPWPKKRHENRRLTHPAKLAIYGRLLAPEGQVCLKTDSRDLFVYSLTEFYQAGWSLGKITEDLQQSGLVGNVMTEYERRFVQLGQPIYRCEAWKGGGV